MGDLKGQQQSEAGKRTDCSQSGLPWALPPTSYMALGKFLDFSVPQSIIVTIKCFSLGAPEWLNH